MTSIFLQIIPLRKLSTKIQWRCRINAWKIWSKEFQGTILRPNNFGCNCTDTEAIGPCPLGGNCLVNLLVYGAEVVSNNINKQTYTGLTRNTFKKRYYGHRHSFTNREQEYSTTLSTFVWQLQDNNKNFKINWKLLWRAKPFSLVTRKCNLCIKEKFHIIFQQV